MKRFQNSNLFPKEEEKNNLGYQNGSSIIFFPFSLSFNKKKTKKRRKTQTLRDKQHARRERRGSLFLSFSRESFCCWFVLFLDSLQGKGPLNASSFAFCLSFKKQTKKRKRKKRKTERAVNNTRTHREVLSLLLLFS